MDDFIGLLTSKKTRTTNENKGGVKDSMNDGKGQCSAFTEISKLPMSTLHRLLRLKSGHRKDFKNKDNPVKS